MLNVCKTSESHSPNCVSKVSPYPGPIFEQVKQQAVEKVPFSVRVKMKVLISFKATPLRVWHVSVKDAAIVLATQTYNPLAPT